MLYKISIKWDLRIFLNFFCILKGWWIVITGPNEIKLFLSVIYEFLYQARVFVRLGWKTCEGQTLQRITKIRKIQTKKFYIISPWPILDHLNVCGCDYRQHFLHFNDTYLHLQKRLTIGENKNIFFFSYQNIFLD